MSKIFKNVQDNNYKTAEHHKNYLSRITKTLYYGKFSKPAALSLPVTELAAELFSEVQKGKSLEKLHHKDAAKISTNACVSPCSLVLALLYLERLKKCNPEYLDKTAPSDLFLVSLMVSSKFLFDYGQSDLPYIDEWAEARKISIKQLVRLEKDFLKAIDWNVYVSEQNFWKKLNEIETTLAKKQGILRGHFTYNELQNLVDTIDVQSLIRCVIAVSTVLSVVYIAGLLTLVSSVFLVSHVPGTSLYNKKMENQKNYGSNDFKDMETEIKFDLEENIQEDIVNNNCSTCLLLESSDNQSNVETNEGSAQHISWDYWNTPSMDWLAKSSQPELSFISNIFISQHTYYLETVMARCKYIELEDSMKKDVKTRIQEQMESSWHKEWTGTFRGYPF